ncbi:MAG: aspartate aminotransferase family protein [Burkholderiaceae bacterium]
MTDVSPLMTTYPPAELGFSHGEGVWLIGHDGRTYLDGLAGIAVNTLGHAHPVLTEALREQVGRLIHCSNLYDMPLQRELAQLLLDQTGMTNVFFCNSGLEANEAAIKLARLHGKRKGIDAPEIIVYEGAFHGRSLATLSATGNAKVHAGFEPLVPGFVRTGLNDIDDLRRIAQSNKNVSAVFLETIQGEGGIRPSRAEYLKQVRELCDANDWLLMLDEVQCGTGRTGKLLAHQWADVKADVVPMAKGLGSGVPIGAVIAHGKAADLFKPGHHGTTFGGNPLAMRAGITTMQVIEKDQLMQNATTVGNWLMSTLKSEIGELAGVKEVRGQGLMIGIEMIKPCPDLNAQALAAGLLLNVTAGNVIRLLPALILTQSEAAEILNRLVPIIRSAANA